MKRLLIGIMTAVVSLTLNVLPARSSDDIVLLPCTKALTTSTILDRTSTIYSVTMGEDIVLSHELKVIHGVLTDYFTKQACGIPISSDEQDAVDTMIIAFNYIDSEYKQTGLMNLTLKQIYFHSTVIHAYLSLHTHA